MERKNRDFRSSPGFPSITASALSRDTAAFFEPGAVSRVVRSFASDRSSQTVDAADGAPHLCPAEARPKRGFVLLRILWGPLTNLDSASAIVHPPCPAGKHQSPPEAAASRIQGFPGPFLPPEPAVSLRHGRTPCFPLPSPHCNGPPVQLVRSTLAIQSLVRKWATGALWSRAWVAQAIMPGQPILAFDWSYP